MKFFIADTFAKALTRLDGPSQKVAKMAAFELQMDPSGKGKSFHRITRSRDDGFWSVRAGRDVRLVLHKAGDRMVLCYVGHHDDAYAWAERRVFEVHPRTHALQIVEVEETVEARTAPRAPLEPSMAPPETMAAPLESFSDDDLLIHGVPESWLGRLRAASEDALLDLALHLPQEAQEAVIALATGETLPPPQAPDARADAAEQPDAQRRFRVVEGEDALKAALDYPWDQWTVFLHPSQREAAYGATTGPTRVGGSAGTGKTVVALHRARMLGERDDAKVLLTTFSDELADALRRKLAILHGDEQRIVPTVTVASFEKTARDLYILLHGREPFLARERHVRVALSAAADGMTDRDENFLYAEFTEVVDGWQITTAEEYAAVSRVGRRSRLGARQRQALWPVFAAARDDLASKGMLTAPALYAAVATAYARRSERPFTNIIADEAQDLGPPELRFLAAIASQGPDALFFAGGDIGQRIFQYPFSWHALGIDLHGRSKTLRVNYRTSEQIRSAADGLLPWSIRDADGNEERRSGTISLFTGSDPSVIAFASEEEETAAVSAWLEERMSEGFAVNELCVIVRDRTRLKRAHEVATRIGRKGGPLNSSRSRATDELPIGTMHLAKGLEYRGVAVMACDDDALPLQERIESVTDESALDEVYETERHLLYVACTRARDALIVCGQRPISEFAELLDSSNYSNM